MWIEPSGNIANEVDMNVTIGNLNNEVYVGTDSHSYGTKWIFATVICCHTPGRGGRFFTKRVEYQKEQFKTLPDRLLQEAHLSIEAAQEIENSLGRKPQIHIDVSKKGSASSKFHSIIFSYVSGMGYAVTSKPDSWASSCVADRQAR